MPAGIPVATMAIGNATNAGLLAARMIGATYGEVATKLEAYSESLKDKVAQMNLEIKL
jgi:5-(carboxyamino)imidazole ribonucleotide mutase